MSPHCVWIITVGGFVDKICTPVTNPNTVMLTELGQFSIHICIPNVPNSTYYMVFLYV